MGYPSTNSCCNDSGLSSLILGLQQQIANLAGQINAVPQTVVVQSSALPSGAATEATLAASAPADNVIAITPNDATALVAVPKALFIGGSGNLTIKGANGVPALLIVQAGQIVPVRARFVMATGTTATGIVAIS